MNSKEMANVINTILTDKKGTELSVIEIPEGIALSDYFVICNGTSVTHIKALADEVDDKLRKEHGIVPLHVEGYNTARWILMDYGDVVVHIFHKEDRDFYKLDKLWSEGLMNWRK